MALAMIGLIRWPAWMSETSSQQSISALNKSALIRQICSSSLLEYETKRLGFIRLTIDYGTARQDSGLAGCAGDVPAAAGSGQACGMASSWSWSVCARVAGRPAPRGAAA